MGFKTRGQVVGHNETRDVIKGTTGSIFTQVAATNREQGGTLATAQVKASGEGWFELKVEGKRVALLTWTPNGSFTIESVKTLCPHGGVFRGETCGRCGEKVA